MHLILELMEGGDLLDRLRKEKQLPEATAKYYFLQIALGVEYFHKQGIAHRDLKPENILLSNNKEDAIVKVHYYSCIHLLLFFGLCNAIESMI